MRHALGGPWDWFIERWHTAFPIAAESIANHHIRETRNIRLLSAEKKGRLDLIRSNEIQTTSMSLEERDPSCAVTSQSCCRRRHITSNGRLQFRFESACLHEDNCLDHIERSALTSSAGNS